MTRKQVTLTLAAVCLVAMSAGRAVARTSNGNDFALYFSEARDNRERAELLADAKGRPHFFRYLQVIEMEEGTKNGRPFVQIVAFEPSSCLDVFFTVTKRVSLEKLADAPKTQKGDAIALTGVVRDATQAMIKLDPVIVRHKDRLSPKRGKELLCEVDPTATFYSYTGGSEPVSLTYKDRDLIRHKSRIIAQSGKQGYTEFLKRELAKRERARAAEKRVARAGDAAVEAGTCCGTCQTGQPNAPACGAPKAAPACGAPKATAPACGAPKAVPTCGTAPKCCGTCGRM